MGGVNSTGFQFNAPGSADTGLGAAISLATQGTDQLYVDYLGNVGIGTEDPSSKLQIDHGLFAPGTTAADKTLLLSSGIGPAANGTYGASIAFNRIASSAGHQPRAAIAIKQYTSNYEQCGLTFFTHPTNTSSDDMVEQMCITHYGNVGISETNPAYKLHVNGGLYAVNYRIDQLNSLPA